MTNSDVLDNQGIIRRNIRESIRSVGRTHSGITGSSTCEGRARS
jgi:hypothetical protein